MTTGNDSQGAKMDQILRIIERSNTWIFADEMSRNSDLNLTTEEINFLLDKIISFHIKVADIRRNTHGMLMTLSNSTTPKFLNGGGFLKIENENNESIKKNLDRENLELELAKSNLEANTLNKKIAKKNEKNEKKNQMMTWINIIIGILNLGILVWQTLKTP